MDPKKVEAYKVASKPSGVWWIIGKEKSDSESNPAPNPDPKRIEPKRRQTADVKPLPPTPTRRATMAAVPTTPKPKRRGSVMSVTPASTTSSEIVAQDQTPGGSAFFPSLTSFTCDVRHADHLLVLPSSCHHRHERAHLASERH